MKVLKKVVSLIISVCFIFNTLLSNYAFAAVTPLNLPAAGQLLPLSKPLPYTVLRGMRINPNDPMKFEFVIDKPKDKAVDKEEFRRLVSYFMAALTIPEQDFWVNLSPYEQDRVIPDAVAGTDFGRDLLAQDYVLKQVAASITYPETALGKAYWDKVYSEAAKAGLSRNQAINAFSKVWIVPENVEIFEDGTLALVGNAKLKVLSESDYTAMNSSSQIATPREASARNDAADKILKEMVIPALTKEVNTGSNFTQLRQMFHSFALALWFKNKLKDSFFKYYINQNKTKGIDLSDKTIKDKIYNQYVAAFKTGVYNMIKKESVGANNHSPAQKITKRQYFSGGVNVYVPGAYTKEFLRDPSGQIKLNLPLELIGKLAEVAPDKEKEELAHHADVLAHFNEMHWDISKVTSVLLHELYLAHKLPDGENVAKVKKATEALIAAGYGTRADNRIPLAMAEELAKVDILGSRLGRRLAIGAGLVTGLAVMNCGDGKHTSIERDASNPDAAGSVSTGGAAGGVISSGGTSGAGGAIAVDGAWAVDASGIDQSTGADVEAGVDGAITSITSNHQGTWWYQNNNTPAPSWASSAIISNLFSTSGILGLADDAFSYFISSYSALIVNAMDGLSMSAVADTTSLVPSGYWNSAGIYTDATGLLSQEAYLSNIGPIKGSRVVGDVILLSGLYDASGNLTGDLRGSAHEIAALVLYRGGSTLVNNAWAANNCALGTIYPGVSVISGNGSTNDPAITAYKNAIATAISDWNNMYAAVESAIPAFTTSNKDYYIRRIVRLCLYSNLSFADFSAQNTNVFTAADDNAFAYALALAQIKVDLGVDGETAVNLYNSAKAHVDNTVVGATPNPLTIVSSSLGIADVAVAYGTAMMLDPAGNHNASDDLAANFIIFNQEVVYNIISSGSFPAVLYQAVDFQAGAKVQSGFTKGKIIGATVSPYDVGMWGFARNFQLVKYAKDAGGDGGMSTRIGLVGKRFTPYMSSELHKQKVEWLRGIESGDLEPEPFQDVSHEYTDAAGKAQKVSETKVRVVTVAFTGAIKEERAARHKAQDGTLYVFFNSKFEKVAGQKAQAVIHEAYEQHVAERLLKEGTKEFSAKELHEPWAVGWLDRLAHIGASALEADLFNGKLTIPQQVDAFDIKSSGDLEAFKNEDRTLHTRLVAELFGAKVQQNYAVSQQAFAEATYGGVDMAKTKIIQHVLGAPVKLSVSAKMVAELKNAKRVGFQVLAVDLPFRL